MLESILLNIILKKIKKAADRYGEEVYDIIHNSPSARVAYTRGYDLGGLSLAQCANFVGIKFMMGQMEHLLLLQECCYNNEKQKDIYGQN